jgi:hypothetical protein
VSVFSRRNVIVVIVHLNAEMMLCSANTHTHTHTNTNNCFKQILEGSDGAVLLYWVLGLVQCPVF